MKSLLSRILLSSLLFISCMAVPAPLSMAETSPSASTSNSNVDCNLTANPDECWRQKNQLNWSPSDVQNLPINSDTWGLKGPIAASLKYDSDLDWILGLNYVQLFTERLGIGAKATFGPNEWRANITAGYSHNEKHQVKVTYEYLNQNLPYDFETGTINSRVDQHAVGGTYQYLLQRGIIHSLELSGIFAQAQSKDLPSLTFYDMNDDPLVNLRRIAGGQETTGLATVNFLPFNTTSLALGAGYSQVAYDTVYENNQNNSTVAFKAELNHVFHPTVRMSASVNNTASSTEYSAKVSKLLPKSFELSVGALRQESRGNLQDANSIVLGISYPAPKSYAMNNLGQGTLAELKNWIDKPVLYYNRVLAVRDQAVKKFTIASQPIPSQTKPIGEVIDSVDTKNYFQFDPTMFDKVDYTLLITPAGKTPPGPDTSKALNITITQNNAYEATVASVAPLPGGQNLEGKYNIQITAVGSKTGLKRPVTEVRTFVLTVLYAGPAWTSKTLPDATINSNYPYPDAAVDLAKDSGTPKGFVSTEDLPEDTYTFKLLHGPSWIKLQDQHLLVANGAVQAEPSKSAEVELEVTSKTLNESVTKKFVIQVNAGAPVWSNTLPDGQYGTTYPGANLNKYVSSPGEIQTDFSFKPEQTLPSWLQLNSDGTLTGIQNIPDNASLDTQIYVTATDKKTGQSALGVLTIHIKPGAPAWIDNTLPDAQQGVEYEQIDLSPKLRTAGLPNGDAYIMTLDSSSPKWLQIVNGHFLAANGKVPSDAPASATVNISAQSTTTQLSATQTFTVTITHQGAPIWSQTDLPNGQYGVPYIKADLHQYVTTPGNSADQYKFDLSQGSSLPAWLQLTNGIIEAAPNSVIPEGAPNVVEIGITVTSTTSTVSTPATLVIKILPGNPVWTDNTLPDAQQGITYEGTDLSPKLHTPGLPQDTYQIALTGTNPPWLQITNGHFLSANGIVPTNAPATVAVTVTATSENAPGTLKATQTFNLTVTKPNAPIWMQTDLPSGQYNNAYPTTDLRQYVTTPGNSKDQYEFTLASTSPPLPSWLDLNNGILQGKQSIPETAPNILEFQVVVKSAITNATTTATLVINILPGNPVWTDNTLPDAQQGLKFPDVDLLPKLHTPGLKGDTYQMSLSGNPSWLKIENGSFLTGDVPSDAPASVPFTVTAVSQTNSALSSSQTFNLVVTKPGAPIWINTGLPNGNYVALYNSSVDLNTYVNTPDKPSQQYTFSPDQPLPSWLTLENGHILTGTKEPIPENTPVVVKLPITVTNTEGISTPGILIINLLPGAPLWSGSLPDAQYNVTYSGVDLIPLVRTPGASSDSYQFNLNAAPSWLKIGADGHSLIGQSPVPETDASPVTVTVTATSTASQLPSQQTFNITINSGAPVWTDNTLPDAQQGVIYIGANLLDKLHTPGIAKDSYAMKLDSPVSWLNITNGQLESTGPVPSDQTSPVQITVTATSAGNTLSASETFSLTVTPVGAPIWSATDLPDGNYGAVYLSGKSINLTDYVSTPGNINDEYLFAPAAGETLPSWLTLDPNGTLQGAGNIPESAPAFFKINVTVTSPVTGKSTTGTLEIHILPGAPIWTGDLPAAQYDATYPKTSLLPFVRTPGATSDTYQFTALQKPSWLTVDSNGNLVGTAPVPESDNSPITVIIAAKSTASGLSSQQTFSVTINPGNPVWIDTVMPSAQEGQTYPVVDLAPKLKTPGLSGDTYQISLDSSSAAWLKVGSDGHSIVGTGPVTDQPGAAQITVTATSQKTVGNLKSPPQTFTITILDGIGWSGLNPDGTTAGTTNYAYLVDNLVSCPANQVCSVTLSNLPSWLSVKSNADGTTSVVSNQPVPAAAQDPSGTVSFDVAASTKSGQTLPAKTFNILINNVLPEWQDPATPPQVNFDGTSDPHLIHLNTYIIQGAADLTLQQGTDFDTTRWKLVKEGNDYYLQRLPGSTDDIGKSFTIPLVASNSTSRTPQAHGITVVVGDNSQLPGPDWSGNNPIATTAGNPAYSYEVNQLVTCPAGDQCALTVTNIPKWLDLQVAADGVTTLVSNQVVPPAAQDPAGIVTFDVAVSSLKSGKTLPTKSFDIQITNVLPKWQDPATPPDVNFDGTSDPHLIHLNTYIVQGAAGLTLQEGAGFDTTKWTLAKEGNDYYLQHLPGSTDDIGKQFSIPLVAANSTSQTPQAHAITVVITSNSSLPGPEWNNNKPFATTAGNPSYSYVVNQLVSCPTGDQCPVTVTNVPAWLDVQVGADGTTTLVSNQVVPPAAQDPSGVVSFDVAVSSVKSGNKLPPQSFDIQITNVLPKWQDLATPPDVNFDGTSDPHLIHLNTYIVQGAAGLTLQEGTGFDTTQWTLVKEGNDYYLQHLPGNTDDIGKQFTIPLVAANSTSQTPQPHAITVIITGNSSLPGPVWNNNKPLATTAGDPSYSYVVNQLVSCPTGDQCPVTVTNVPAWLDVQVGADGTTTLVSNQVVPPAAQDPSGVVSFDVAVSSVKSGNKLPPQSFDIQITNVLPKWQDPTTPPDVNFDGTSDPHLIHLNTYIVQGAAGLTLQEGTGFDTTQWTLVKEGNDYYLQHLPGSTDDIGKQFTIPLVAANSTSQTPQPHAITVVVTGNSSLPGPEWNNNKPLATIAGNPSYSYVVNQLVSCPTGDQCPVTVTNVPAWLDVQVNTDGTTTLVSNQVVPPAAQDPSGVVSFDVAVSSVKSGNKLPPQSFDIQITNVLPKWQDPTTPPDVNFDGTSDPHLIHLNTYIIQGAAGLTLLEGTGFDTTKWKLVKEGADYYLVHLPGSIEDIGQHFNVSLIAGNSTSQTPQPHEIEVVIGPDTALGAPIKQADIPEASMGYQYPIVDLNTVFKAPVVGDKLSFSFAANGGQQWLSIQPCVVGGNATTCLMANGFVPTTADDNFTVTIHATSMASNQSVDQPFTAQVLKQSPIWSATPSGTIQFNSIDPALPAARIELGQFITSNTGNNETGSPQPVLSFKLHDPNDPNWVVTQEGSGKYYLTMTATNPAYENAALVNTPVSPAPEIDAYNNTSNTPVTHSIQVITGPDAQLPGPQWTQNNPAEATAGSDIQTYSYALTNLFVCQANDYCSITVDLSGLNWLQSRYLNGTQEAFLENSATVPAAATDPSGPSAPFTVTIFSQASGLSISKVFNIQINNVLPEWDQQAIGGLIYNGTSPDNTIRLNDYVTTGTAGLNFIPGTNFDPDKWQIINPQGTTDYYLKKLAPGNPNEIGTTPVIPVLAKNATSADGKQSGVSVNILPDAQLPVPSWKDSVLPAAQMGEAYGDGTVTAVIDLNQLVSTQGEPNDSFEFSFDTSVTPPSWLALNNGHLESAQVPNDDAMPASFSVAISAKSKASGESKSYTFTNVPINQTLPGWDTSVDYKNWSIVYDDTDKGIKLGPYITSGTTSLTFSFPGNQTTMPNWQIVLDTSDNAYYLRRTTSVTDPQLPSDINTSVTLNLVAHNSTSTSSNQEKAPQAVTIKILPDSSKAPSWTSTTIPDAYMGYTYGDTSKTGVIDLSSIVTTTGITKDAYNFSFDKSVTPPAWLIFDKTTGSLLISDPAVNNGNVPTTSTDFSVAVVATSIATGNTATITFNVKVLATLPVWQGVKQSSLYFDDLATSVPTTDPSLASWINTGTNKGIAFEIDPADPTKCATNFVAANWKLASASATISRTTSDTSDIYDGVNSSTIVRIPVLATNGTSPADTGAEQCIPVEVQARPADKPIWNSNSLPPIYGGEAGRFTYPWPAGTTANLSSFLSDAGNNAFTCKINQSDVSWMEVANDTSNNAQLLIGNGSVPPIDNKPGITLQCQSKKTGQWSDPHTFTIDVAPVLKLSTDSDIPALTSLKFDDVDTGTGVKINDLLISGRTGAHIELIGNGTNYIPANWTVATDGGVQYLRRTAPSNKIDAADLVANQGKVNINMQATNSTSSLQDTANYPFTLLPDPQLIYKYADTSFSTSLRAVQPDAIAGMYQSAAVVSSSTVHAYVVDPQGALRYLILNDDNFVFSNPGNQPAFISYGNLPKIDIGYPGYSDLGLTNIQWNVGVKSTANGATQTIMVMPPLSVNSVTLAPPVNNGVSGIMTLGTDHWGGPPPALSQDYWTYLWLQLKPNTTYTVLQAKYSVVYQTTATSQICSGKVTQTPSPSSCGNGSTQLGRLDSPNAVFTTDSSGIVTFIVGSINNDGSQNRYPQFLTDATNPFSNNQNIVLQVQ